MTKISSEWLNAYFDQELNPVQSRLVTEHLAECPECQAYLSQLSDLRKNLLNESELHGLKSEERFLDEIKLQLPGRPMQDPINLYRLATWYGLPLGLIISILIWQVFSWFTGFLSLIPGGNQLLISAIPFSMQATDWAQINIFGLNFNLRGLTSLFEWNLFSQLWWLAFAAILYCLWMVWWFLRNSSPTGSYSKH